MMSKHYFAIQHQGGVPEKEESRVIRVESDVYLKLLQIKANLSFALGRSVSLGDAVKELLKDYKVEGYH